MRLAALVLSALLAAVPILASPSRPAAEGRVEEVTFPTNVVEGTRAAEPVMLRATLHLPERPPPLSAVVITPSSGGEKEVREGFYARRLAEAGIAALVVRSFGSRGLLNSVADQSVLTGYQTENDAVGALRWLANDPRFRRDRIAITGVSKGGQAALNTAFLVRRRWTRAAPLEFAAHVPIAPPCGLIQADQSTTRRPIFFMLAELDDQTPAAPCANLAESLRRSGHPAIEVKIYEGAHHAWEQIGPRAFFDHAAQNFSRCRGTIDDAGGATLADGSRVPASRLLATLTSTCMTLGAHCCGGTEKLREEGARDMIAFLRRQGF